VCLIVVFHKRKLVREFCLSEYNNKYCQLMETYGSEVLEPGAEAAASS